MSQIQIEFKGTYQLDGTTSCTDPIVTVTAATDDMVENVSTVSVFSNVGYTYSRSTGSFTYQESWENQDVIDHLTAWMQERKI
jgi:hypothetical protein